MTFKEGNLYKVLQEARLWSDGYILPLQHGANLKQIDTIQTNDVFLMLSYNKEYEYCRVIYKSKIGIIWTVFYKFEEVSQV